MRMLLLTALLLSGTAAIAEDGSPPIAYATSGKTPGIYLVNPDGSSPRLIYRAGNRMRVFGIDLKPGGGEVSFEEVPCCSSGPGTLKTVRYAPTGTLGTVVRSIPICRAQIDYHPTDGSLLLIDSCERVLKRLPMDSTTATAVGLPGQAFKARWLSDGDGFIYGGPGGWRRSSVSSPTSSTLVHATDILQYLDTGRQSEQMLIAADRRIDHLNLASGAFSKGIEQGDDPRFDPTDQRFIYITPPQRDGSYLLIRRVDGQGSPDRIGGKGSYTSVDWRK